MQTDLFLPDLARHCRDAAHATRNAVQDGKWEPEPDTDPLGLASEILAELESGFDSSDLGLAAEMADQGLAAIEMGDWSDASDDVVATLQNVAFLAGYLIDPSDCRPVCETAQCA